MNKIKLEDKIRTLEQKLKEDLFVWDYIKINKKLEKLRRKLENVK